MIPDVAEFQPSVHGDSDWKPIAVFLCPSVSLKHSFPNPHFAVPLNAPVDALVAFGSNIGDASQSFQHARQRLSQLESVQVQAVAKLIETRPVLGVVNESDDEPLPCYQNSVFRIRTTLSANELFKKLLELEQELGRKRNQRWGPRTIDLDLLLLGDQVIATESLTLPHPRMSFRRFVLQPAAEIAGDMVHPVCGCTIQDLLQSIDQDQPEIGFLVPEASDFWETIARSNERFEKKWTPKKIFLKPDFHVSTTSLPANLATQKLMNGIVETQRQEEAHSVWQSLQIIFVMMDVRPKQWMKLNQRFRGPTLFLEDNQTSKELDWTREISAALEAIEKVI